MVICNDKHILQSFCIFADHEDPVLIISIFLEVEPKNFYGDVVSTYKDENITHAPFWNQENHF